MSRALAGDSKEAREAARQAFFAMKRIDLWWHALDEEQGAYYDLRRDECVAELHREEEIGRAAREAPEDTPAARRAAFVVEHASAAGRVSISWDRAVDPRTGRVVRFDVGKKC